MIHTRGSEWRKWDLHIHTPASIVHGYGAAGWDHYIEALSALPPEIKVIGINDYLFIDGYRRVLEAKRVGKLPNLDLVLPVVELRIDKFGGTAGKLSRVNLHIIFSDAIGPDIIESQFLAALCSKYVLSPQYKSSAAQWAMRPTRESLEELGDLIKANVPQSQRAKFGTSIVEGFNALCVSFADVLRILEASCFQGKVMTAVGKTEWADVKWNDHAIAEKKNIINNVDLVFISSESPSKFDAAQQSLASSNVNARLLDCSDAHHFADSTEKDRLGNCLTWIKADATFEGLRQALIEYPHRISISEQKPIAPLLQISSVTLEFPDDTRLVSKEGDEPFCLQKVTIPFSPYLTCIIGGRGVGKSTLLNLMHERLHEGKSKFFRENRLQPKEVTIAACVRVDGISAGGDVEFLQQNEIEQLAHRYERLTEAIFFRLRKLDSSGQLTNAEKALTNCIESIAEQRRRLTTRKKLQDDLLQRTADLKKQQWIVDSFADQNYKNRSEEQRRLSARLQGTRSDRKKYELFLADLIQLIEPASVAAEKFSTTSYRNEITRIVQGVRLLLSGEASKYALETSKSEEDSLERDILVARTALADFLISRGLSEENLTEAGQAAEKISEIEQQIACLNDDLNAINAHIDSFEIDRSRIESYDNVVANLLEPVNDVLQRQGDEVRPILLRHYFDLSAFRQKMLDELAGELTKLGLKSVRQDYLETTLAEIDFVDLGDQSQVLERIREDKYVHSEALRTFLQDELNFAKLRLTSMAALHDFKTFGRIEILYDGKPISGTSFGQRCSAVIIVMILLGNTPIIIDEPEAHLDSSLIARHLVELVKASKIKRQIVFVTHNANFVINGDAELIHCMSMTQDKLTNVVSTTIENLEHRHLLLAMEGGRDAFHRREVRYGLRLLTNAISLNS